MQARHALQTLWDGAGAAPDALARVEFGGDDAFLPSVHRIGTLATATIAAAGLAAAECLRLRTDRAQMVSVDARAALAAFRSERYLRIDGAPAPDPRDPVTGFYRTRDGRWIQLHANFAHHRQSIADLLGCENAPEPIAAAILAYDGGELDTALAQAGLCAALIRTPEEWAVLDAARALARRPLFEIERIGDAPPRAIGAGPVAGRTLAQHGADVLLVNGPHLPNIPALVVDNGRGKRSAHVDLREAQGRETLDALAAGADVFLQSYRPGSLAARGFSDAALAARHPGIVCVSVCAYGYEGPWAARRGFEAVSQT